MSNTESDYSVEPDPHLAGVESEAALPTPDPKHTSQKELLTWAEQRYPQLCKALKILAVVGVFAAPSLACSPEVTSYNPDNPNYVNPQHVQSYDLQQYNAEVATQQALQQALQNATPQPAHFIQPNTAFGGAP